MDDIVYFVYAIYKDGTVIPMGVWDATVRDICKQFKKGGPRISQYTYGDCLYIRVVERIWVEPTDGPAKIISEQVLYQRDMRRLAR